MRTNRIWMTAAVAVALALVAPSTAFAQTAPIPTTQTYYFRMDEICGPAYLSVEPNQTETNCIWLTNTLGVNDIDGATWVYEAVDGLPFILDASRAVDGTLLLDDWACIWVACPLGGGSVGQATVDFTLDGEIGGQVVRIGTDSKTYQLQPTGPSRRKVEFHIPLNSTLDLKDVSALTMTVYIHGVSPGHGSVIYSQDSRFALPTYSMTL